MTIRDIPWTVPFNVRLQDGLERRFRSVGEALDFLQNEWPLKRGERHQRAVSVCQRALKKMVPPAVARECFIAACLEAGLAATLSGPTYYGSHADKPISTHIR